jgi:hypothetical protein
MDEISQEIDDRSEALVDEFLAGGERRRPMEGENIAFTCSHSKKQLDDITKCIDDDKNVAANYLSRVHQSPFEIPGEMPPVGDRMSLTKVHFSDPEMSKKEKKAASKQFITMKMLRKDTYKKHDKCHRYSENPILEGKSLAVTMEQHGDNVQLLLLKRVLSVDAQVGQKVLAFLRECDGWSSTILLLPLC